MEQNMVYMIALQVVPLPSKSGYTAWLSLAEACL